MPLFVCTSCQYVDNTALANFWTRTVMNKQPALCSLCDPDIAKWHDQFPRITGEEYRKQHPEGLRWFLCPFCGGEAGLLCDGNIYDNGHLRARVPMAFDGGTSTCDNGICRTCAQQVGAYHLNRGRNGCSWETVDLCPLCQAAQGKPTEITPPFGGTAA